MVSMSKNVIKIHWRHDIDEKIKIQSAMWFRRNEQNTSATWFRRKYRLWQPWRNKIDLEVLGLSLFPSPDIDNWMEANPEQQVVTTMQVHQGDQPRLPPSCIASLACVCMMAACPLHKQKTNKRRSFTSLQMSHTHTPCQSRVSFLEEYSGLTCRCTNCCEPSKLWLTRLLSVYSEVELEACCRTWIASWKLMCATILHGSLSSPDAVAAVSESDNCLAKAEIVVTCPASSGDGVVSMATLRKGLFPCSRGISKWWRQ